MEKISEDSTIASAYAAYREGRRRAAIEHRIDAVRKSLGQIPYKYEAMLLRKKRLDEQDKKLIEGISLLKRNRAILGDNGLFEDPSTRAVTADDAQSILRLYDATGLSNQNPGLTLHLKLTGDIAATIAQQLRTTNIETESTKSTENAVGGTLPTIGQKLRAARNINPEAVRGMGYGRNVSMFFGQKDYHAKDLASREVWDQLDIHPTYIRYLRPPFVDSGPMGKQTVEDRGNEIRNMLTAEQMIVEFAGLIAKHKAGRLLSYGEIRGLARKTRGSPKAYGTYVGQTPASFAGHFSAETLNEDFEEQWIQIYDLIANALTKQGVDLEDLRRKMAEKHGLSL